ncbi:glycine betaine ABC transporter substrate-binding protein [Asticcacaulis sp.]|uniref:glycine betaine ABC transporter substrate-binding protein n=1 Tax=Asticcacaulis sp. TaxID=1872648 RepID=UPI003F7B9DDD
MWACVLVLLFTGLSGPALAKAECPVTDRVRFAGVNWESGEFITAVMQEIIERGYGCTTETVPGNTVTLEQALANDDIQILAEEWVSRSDVWKKAADDGSVRAIGHPFTEAREGWYVPDYMVHGVDASAPGLNSVGQLADPRYVALFRDPEQPDKGRFLNCPSGWTCEGVNSAKLKAYGLTGAYVDFRPGTGPAMDAAITSAYAQKQPILFYYWSPSPIAGRLKLVQLKEPPWSAACWADLTSRNGRHTQGCAAPPADVAYGVSTRFATKAPAIAAMLAKATFPIDDLNANLVRRADGKLTARAQAMWFLQNRPDLWRQWVDAQTAGRISASLRTAAPVAKSNFPARWMLSIRQPVNDAVAGLVRDHGAGFRAISNAGLSVIVALDGLLGAVPWWLLIAVFMGLTWAGTRRTGLTLAVGGLMLVIGLLGLWSLMTQTLTLMLIASFLAVMIGLPVGIAAAKSRWIKSLSLPVLDIMQTLPAFVYLIPALMLFGLGKVPAILATVIYALPPMIRLTTLGIERVDNEAREAGDSFGLTPWQRLWRVELPLARPTLMAGLNQTIMLALSMVVVASMIGARGLGEQVLNGIQTLDVGMGLEAGLGIVILAFVLDRITQGFGGKRAGHD